MSWTKRIAALHRTLPDEATYKTRLDTFAGSSHGAILSAETALDTKFPNVLISLLLETNGVAQMMCVKNDDWFLSRYSAWPLDEIVSQNLWHRDIYDEDGVNRYLFISSPGVDGIMFGFDATNTCREDGRIVAWFPDDTPVRTMADDFWSFFSGWETGELSV